MATIPNRQVIEDVGSQELLLTVENVNNLITVVGDLITALKSSGDGITAAAAVIAEAAMEATVETINRQPGTIANPRRPVY